jgi:biopolymer transport protein ExbD
MARRAHFTLEGDEDPELDISSLIDVSFLLLIYFIVTSTLQKHETDLGITLPSTVPTESTDPVDPLAIKISTDGAITVDDIELEGPAPPDEPSTVPALRTRLQEYKTQTELVNEKPMVVLAAADDGKTQRFVDVVNALASVKIQSITMTGFREEK